jgi:hypothetical protein
MIRRVAFTLAALAAVTFARGAAPNTLSPEEKAAGWKLLFDGRTLSGWRSYSSEKPPAGWAAADGAIVRTKKSGDLVTKDEFADFELSVEWRVVAGTNSGIIYRARLSGDKTDRTGPEYQIADANMFAARKAAGVVHPKGETAALYDLVAPKSCPMNATGEWNTTRIVVRGWKIEHWLNGEQVVDVDLGSAAGRALIAESKFKDMPSYATLPRGHLALQDHDEAVYFRNLKIRDLAPTRGAAK